MNINYKQPQFELFPASSATLEDVNKPKFLLANLTLSLESLVILTILVIMVALFTFSLGVERGKHLAAQALDERVGAAWNLAPHKPVLPTVAAKPAVVAKVAMTPAKPIGNAGVMTATAAVVAKPSVVAASTTRYTVQLASYKNEAYARQDALSLKANGLPSFLIKKGNFWLLCVGQLPSKDNADALAKRLQPKFKNLSVRRF